MVGPESAGSNPGPVCYRKNGYLTVTDANLILGRIIPDFFPHIFGPTEDQPLDRRVRSVLKTVSGKVPARHLMSYSNILMHKIRPTDRKSYRWKKLHWALSILRTRQCVGQLER